MNNNITNTNTNNTSQTVCLTLPTFKTFTAKIKFLMNQHDVYMPLTVLLMSCHTENTLYRNLEIVNFNKHTTHTAYHHYIQAFLKMFASYFQVVHTNTSSHLDCINLPQLLNIPKLLHCIRLQLLLRVHD